MTEPLDSPDSMVPPVEMGPTVPTVNPALTETTEPQDRQANLDPQGLQDHLDETQFPLPIPGQPLPQ